MVLNTFENCHHVPYLTDASFKWFDQSNMTFDKWADEDGEDLVDTCGFLYAKTGEWRKGNCEMSSVTGTLCKTASKSECLFSSLGGMGNTGFVLDTYFRHITSHKLRPQNITWLCASLLKVSSSLTFQNWS